MNGALPGKAIALVVGGLLIALLRRRRSVDDPWQRATEAHRVTEAHRAAVRSAAGQDPAAEGS